MKNQNKKRYISFILLIVMLLSVGMANAENGPCPRCGQNCYYSDYTTTIDNGTTSHTVITSRTYQCGPCLLAGYHPGGVIKRETHPYHVTYSGNHDVYYCTSCPKQIWAAHTHRYKLVQTIYYKNFLKTVKIYKCVCGATKSE